jgi:hypothetical protein
MHARWVSVHETDNRDVRMNMDKHLPLGCLN